MKPNVTKILSIGITAILAGCASQDHKSISRINPDGVFDTTKLGFPQVVVSNGGKLLFTNSVAMDTEMNIIGVGSLDAQMKKCLSNLRILLESSGATPGDIVQMRVNVVNLQDDSRHIVIDNLNEFYGDYGRGSNALIGVDRLARKELLVEIEIIAAIN